MSFSVYRRRLITILIAIISIIVLLEYFTANPTLRATSNTISTWAAIVISFSLTVAFFTMVYKKGMGVISKEPGEWYYNVIFLAVLCIQTFLGLTSGVTNYYYSKIWLLNLAGYGAMTASIGLYILSSAYRVMRIRNNETLTLIVVAVLIILGQTTLGETIWSGFPMIRDWIWSYPAAAVMRGITIVTAVGTTYLILRVISGISTIVGEASEEAEGV